MRITDDQCEPDNTGQPLWAAPAVVVRAIIAALLHFLGLVQRMKAYNSNTRFKPTWRDSYEGLRLCEWNRARMRAMVAGAILRGEDPDDLPPFEMDDSVPEGFGGPCPSSPLEMNRRFLSIARFRLDPHADIQRYVRRLAKRERIDISGCPPVSPGDPRPPRSALRRKAPVRAASAALFPPPTRSVGEVARRVFAARRRGQPPAHRPHVRPRPSLISDYR